MRRWEELEELRVRQDLHQRRRLEEMQQRLRRQVVGHRRRREELEQQLRKEKADAELATYQAFAADAEAEAQAEEEEEDRRRRQTTKDGLEYLRKWSYNPNYWD